VSTTPATVPAARRQGGSSVITYRMGGRDYPLRTVAQCKVCSSPHRFEIEKEIASGRVYQRIIDSLLLEDPDHDLSVQNLRTHYRQQHMPLDIEAGRRILERRAEQRGLDVAAGVDTLVDGVALAETVVQKTYEALARGELKPDLREGLAAARLLETFAPAESGADAAVYAQVFMVYHEIAQMLMTPGQFEEFGRRLADNPTLRALIHRYSEAHSTDEEDDSDIDLVVEIPREIDNGVGHD